MATVKIVVMCMPGLHTGLQGWMAQGTVGLEMPPGTVEQVLLVPSTVDLQVTTQGYITAHLPHDMVELIVRYSATGAAIGCRFEKVTVFETWLVTSSWNMSRWEQVVYPDYY